MTTHQLSLTVEGDRNAVLLTIAGDDDRLLFGARLEAPELDELIHALAQGRAQLLDEVAPELDQGARLTDVEVDPGYLVGTSKVADEALIAFRHPGFGWLGFRLHRKVIGKFTERLDRWLQQPVPAA
ncbi:hypothetical protein [Sphingomonas sp.]|uniref:hypothetical protein n=1 Tax=Sphingomonas sp. TaxID=28214 RepID=UPI003CC605A3